MKNEIINCLNANRDLGQEISNIIAKSGITVFDSSVLLTALIVIGARSAGCDTKDLKTVMSATVSVANDIIDAMHKERENHDGGIHGIQN